MTITLPYPPSVNRYWRQFRGRAILSAEARAYHERCRYLGTVAVRAVGTPGPIQVHLIAYPPDKRRRDLDNILKAINDALVRCGLIDDDSLIRRQCQEWGPVDRDNPRVVLSIGEYRQGATHES